MSVKFQQYNELVTLGLFFLRVIQRSYAYHLLLFHLTGGLHTPSAKDSKL